MAMQWKKLPRKKAADTMTDKASLSGLQYGSISYIPKFTTLFTLHTLEECFLQSRYSMESQLQPIMESWNQGQLKLISGIT